MLRKIWTKENLQAEAAKYGSRNAFNKNSRRAYKAAWRAGILDEICLHMCRPSPARKWTIRTLRVEAQKYETRTELSVKASGAYDAAIKLGCLDKICKHMVKPKRLTDFPKLVIEWDLSKNEGCFPEDFSKGSKRKVWWRCKYGHEWQAFIYNRTNGTGCPKCSNQSSKNEVRLFKELSVIYSNVIHRAKVGGYEVDVLIPDHLIAIEYDGKFAHAGQSKTESDEKKNNLLTSKGYRILRVREHPLKKLYPEDIIIPTSSMLTKRQMDQVVYWISGCKHETVAYLKNDSFLDERGYQTHLETFPGPAEDCSFGALFPELANEWHTERNGNKSPADFTPGSNEKVWWQCRKNPTHVWDASIAKRVNGRGCRFCSGQQASAETCLAENHPDISALWHPTKNGDINPSSVVSGSTVARWWKCVDDPSHEWEAPPRKLTRMLSKDYCPHCRHKWTSENLREVAFKFESRNDFRKVNSAAYQAARKRGILDEICAHMKPSQTGKKWNFEACKMEAKKYQYRSEFEEGASGCYDAALKNNWLHEVCGHMKPKPRG